MAGPVPYIVMAFANPDNDLDFMEEEEKMLSKQLNRVKSKGDIDLLSLRNATREDILDSFIDLKNQKPCFFHYSGHSNGVVLNLHGKESPGIFELSKILENKSIKIVFLNGCSTQGFVEGILKIKSVKAVIATRSPVKDYQAKEISIEFYKNFIINRQTLQDSFNALLTKPANTLTCIDVNGFDTTREIGWEKVKRLDKDTEFSWGLFYSDPLILNSRYTDLVNELPEEINELIIKRDQAQKDVNVWKGLLKGKNPGDEGYENLTELLTKSEKDYNDAQSQIVEIVQNKEDRDRELSEQNKQRQLENALKILNYEKQRKYYVLKNNCFGSFAVQGDQYSFHDLLCYNFRWENNIGRNDSMNLFINGRLPGFAGFWKKLAFELLINLQEPVKPPGGISNEYIKEVDAYQQGIIARLLNYYLERDEQSGNRRPTKRDIVIKIMIGNTEMAAWVDIISDFWKQVSICISKDPPINRIADYSNWHKLTILLFDEDTSNEKQNFLKQNFDVIKPQLPSVFLTLPPIDPISMQEICDWIENNRLHIIGLDRADAENLYKESQQGKLTKLIALLKEKTKYEDIEIFQILNETAK